jgi:hypothetical protein
MEPHQLHGSSFHGGGWSARSVFPDAAAVNQVLPIADGAQGGVAGQRRTHIIA